MAEKDPTGSTGPPAEQTPASETQNTSHRAWMNPFKRSRAPVEKRASACSSHDEAASKSLQIPKWSLGILNDKHTDEVPGSVLLMSKQHARNEPLGLRHTPARTSASSLPSPYGPEPPPRRSSSTAVVRQRPEMPRGNSSHSVGSRVARVFSNHSTRSAEPEKKMTADGKIILEPQPDDSLNDPLNWPALRRDVALLSLGFYCMLGGGMTPVLAAGFNDVSETYGVSVPSVALSTGFYMAGMGVGSVFASPTAILFGKRPVYLVGATLLILSSVWCALSPSYPSLVAARVIQGVAISPVECLPSATIAEIFFLHERAYRLGIYTLLLLGGKNLIPLVSAAIIGSLGWRWVFWIVAMVAGFCLALLFFFVPETFWDRTPRARAHKHKKPAFENLTNLFSPSHHKKDTATGESASANLEAPVVADTTEGTIAQRRKKTVHHVGFVDRSSSSSEEEDSVNLEKDSLEAAPLTPPGDRTLKAAYHAERCSVDHEKPTNETSAQPPQADALSPRDYFPTVQTTHDLEGHPQTQSPNSIAQTDISPAHDLPPSGAQTPLSPHLPGTTTPTSFPTYTSNLQSLPPQPYLATLKPWNGRLRRDSWLKVAVRPFILFAYPGILWSTLVYSLSVGWLIVLSESVSQVFRNRDTYNFDALQTGLVYLSPFVGGVLGTAVAGRVSDIIVRYMARRNDGVYEPEFRLVMAGPVLLATVIGLMGFGWSAEERDSFWVPTVFFGVIGFGCTLGSTTAITFAVDAYRAYAGEALVTLNFSKNIFHGLVFSLFFPSWLEADGSKQVFIVIGGVQVACLLTAIPMYIYGKRARMWTVRKNMMERF